MTPACWCSCARMALLRNPGSPKRRQAASPGLSIPKAIGSSCGNRSRQRGVPVLYLNGSSFTTWQVPQAAV